MTNPFEPSAAQHIKTFTVEYHNARITAEISDHYRLTWPDDRWLVMSCQEDYSKTLASTDEDTRKAISCHWVIDSTSGGPDWINREQLQVIGELISRKEQEYDRHK